MNAVLFGVVVALAVYLYFCAYCVSLTESTEDMSGVLSLAITMAAACIFTGIAAGMAYGA